MDRDVTDARRSAAAEILGRSGGVYSGMALLAGMRLDVFTPLAEGPLSPEALAATLDVDAGRLSRLLHALATAGLLERKADGRFENSPSADRVLVQGRPGYVGGVHDIWRELWEAGLHTAESIRTGRPQALHDFETATPEEQASFFRGLHGGAVSTGRILAEELDFKRMTRLFDVGGGSGGVAIGACGAAPNLRATVLELPQVAPVARAFVREAGLAERIDVEAVDLASRRPAGGCDVAVLRYLLQTVSAEVAAAILRNLGEAMPVGAEVHVIGWILDDSRLSPPEAVAFDVVFLNLYEGGAAFTVSEHAAWLEAAGFGDVRCRNAPAGAATPGQRLITARRL